MQMSQRGIKNWIQDRVRQKRYFNSEHIVRDLTQKKFNTQDLETVLLEGRILETHSHPLREKSFLMLGYLKGRAVHLFFTRDEQDLLIVLYAYFPNLPTWKNETERIEMSDQKMKSELKKCFFCNGEIEQITVGNFDFRWEGGLYVIKKVPAGLCVQCGEKYISAEASQKIVEKIESRQLSGEDKVFVFDYVA